MAITKAFSVAGCVAAFVVVVPASSAPPKMSPSFGYAYTKDTPTRVNYNCDHTSNPRQLDCQFTILRVKPPNPAEVAREIETGEKELRAELAKNPAKFWADLCKIASRDFSAEPEFQRLGADEKQQTQAFVAMVKESCARKDVTPFVQWSANDTRKKLETCTIREEVFRQTMTQVDEDNWQGIVAPSPLCKTTSVLSFWRDPKNLMWNFRDVETTPEGVRDENCKDVPRVRVEDYRWSAGRTTWPIQCKLVSFGP